MNRKMNKKEFVAKVASIAEIQKKDAVVVVDTVFNVILSVLANKGEVRLSKFGRFEVRKRAIRNGRNPKTGEKFVTSPSNVPVFIAGKVLKSKINNKM